MGKIIREVQNVDLYELNIEVIDLLNSAAILLREIEKVTPDPQEVDILTNLTNTKARLDNMLLSLRDSQERYYSSVDIYSSDPSC